MATILIVEDEEVLSLMTKKILQNSKIINLLKYEIEIISNVPDAIKWLSVNIKPQLIITDFKMPELNGDDFVEYCIDKKMEIPFIAMSGNIDSLIKMSKYTFVKHVVLKGHYFEDFLIIAVEKIIAQQSS